MNPYGCLIPRLNGKEIEDNFDYYLGLVKKGIAGFILFGGELDIVRARLKELQRSSQHQLIIASDLEQGLGQQVEGGTLFPPAMAVASAVKGLARHHARSILKRLYHAMSLEAGYAGVNTVLAPVLDINTNPKNPIIATRAFGEDVETVSFLGCKLIETLQENGIMACGKHFPGHGDTEVDSHISLPVVGKELSSLEGHELVPFRKAIDAGVGMMMLGHLAIPALDPSGTPASLSARVVSYLKKTLRFQGIVITDAMNMGGLAGYPEKEASLVALRAGVDIVLHPTDPDEVAGYLKEKHYSYPPSASLTPFVSPIHKGRSEKEFLPDFAEHKRLSEEITRMAIRTEGDNLPRIKKPFIIILNEDREDKEPFFVRALQERYPDVRSCTVVPEEEIPWHMIPKDSELIIAAFSSVRAWKTSATRWIEKTVRECRGKARIFVSFGNPYILYGLWQDVTKISAFWDSSIAQRAVAEKILAFHG